MVMYDNEFQTKENKIWTKDKNNWTKTCTFKADWKCLVSITRKVFREIDCLTKQYEECVSNANKYDNQSEYIENIPGTAPGVRNTINYVLTQTSPSLPDFFRTGAAVFRLIRGSLETKFMISKI